MEHPAIMEKFDGKFFLSKAGIGTWLAGKGECSFPKFIQ